MNHWLFPEERGAKEGPSGEQVQPVKNQPPITVPPKSQSISIVSETIGPCAALMKQSTRQFLALRPPERAMNRKTKWKQRMVVKDVFVCERTGFCVCTTVSTLAGVVLGLLILHPHTNTLEDCWAYRGSPVSWCRSALFCSPDPFCIEAWEVLQSSDYHRDPSQEQPLLGQTGSEGTGAVGWPLESPHSSNDTEGTIVLCARCGQSSLSHKTASWSKVWKRKKHAYQPRCCVKRLVHLKRQFCPHFWGTFLVVLLSAW